MTAASIVLTGRYGANATTPPVESGNTGQCGSSRPKPVADGAEITAAKRPLALRSFGDTTLTTSGPFVIPITRETSFRR